MKSNYLYLGSLDDNAQCALSFLAQGEEDVFQDYEPAEFSKYDDFDKKGEGRDFEQNTQTLTKTSARVSF